MSFEKNVFTLQACLEFGMDFSLHKNPVDLESRASTTKSIPSGKTRAPEQDTHRLLKRPGISGGFFGIFCPFELRGGVVECYFWGIWKKPSS